MRLQGGVYLFDLIPFRRVGTFGSRLKVDAAIRNLASEEY